MNVYEDLYSPQVKVNREGSVPGGFEGLLLLRWGSSFSNCSKSEPQEALENADSLALPPEAVIHLGWA